jgi:hypothetical protein
MYKRFLIFLSIALPAGNLQAQDVKPIGYEQNVLFHNEMTFGLVAHSHGVGLNFRRGKNLTAKKKAVLEVEFVNMRHEKEKKTYNPFFDNPKGFYYGKLNALLVLRSGYGLQKTLFAKADGKGVEIRYAMIGGLSLGLAKPVYLEVIQETSNQFFFDVATEKYDPEKHFVDNIYGRAPFFKGADQTKVYPGLYGKFGLSFEYGPENDNVKAIETGVCVDVYPKVIPQMAFTTNHQVFLSLYLNFLWGRKWY